MPPDQFFTRKTDRGSGGTRWIIGVVAACGLICVGFVHLDVLLSLLAKGFNLIWPIILGGIFAFLLNIPMSFLERHLPRWKRNSRHQGNRSKTLRRLAALLLSLAAVIGLLVLVGVLVAPEMISAMRILVDNIMTGIDSLQQMENDIEQTATPLSELLSRVDIDWSQLRSRLQALFKDQQVWTEMLSAAGTAVNSVVDVFFALAVSFHALFNKERIIRQLKRLVDVWLPEKTGQRLVHIASVSGQTFHQFIVGQLTEALLLGSLCAVGMLLLRIPYAPMIGAVISVTALIPILGAYIGAFVGAVMIVSVSPFKALVFLIYLLILQQVEGNLIYPRVVGTKLKLPGLWVLTAIIIGGGIGGPMDMLIAVPVIAIFYRLLNEATEHRAQRLGK